MTEKNGYIRYQSQTEKKCQKVLTLILGAMFDRAHPQKLFKMNMSNFTDQQGEGLRLEETTFINDAIKREDEF